MRLFELATELKTSARDLYRQAKGMNADIQSVISLVSPEDERIIRSGFHRRLEADIAREENEVQARLREKAEKAVSLARANAKADAELLDAAAKRAAEYVSSERPLDRFLASRPAVAAVEKPTKKPVAEAKPVAIEAKPISETKPAAEEKPVAEAKPVALKKLAEATSSEEKKAEPAVAAPEESKATAPAEPALPPAAQRAIGGIAPLPVRRTVAPRPEFVLPVRTPRPAPVKKAPPQAMHPADTATAGAAPRGTEKKGGLQGAGGVSQTARRIQNDTQENRDIRRDKKRERQEQRQEQRQELRQEQRRQEAAQAVANGTDKEIPVRGTIVVKDFAEKLGIRPNQLITELMKMGVLASINQSIDAETAGKIAVVHGFTVVHEKRRNSDAKPVYRDPSQDDEIPEDRPDQLRPRPPVVTFLGHVDHGKTTLMDYIRSAHVAAGEAGGITQAISAYSVEVSGRSITFLDTPGHAAFSAMRTRGASLTDVAVIIIAADDGIMPQTKEAIQAARNAHVTIMVAITKCDKPSANVMRVMQQLQNENLTPEEWGGDTVVCQVSGITGEGVGNLLDMILLQADVLELSANPDRRANGSVIEASMAPGSGPVVNVLVTGGTLNVGDIMICNEFYGKIRALTDSNGRRLKSAGPSSAVSVMGLSGVPEAGAEFRVLKNEKRAREIAEKAAIQRKEQLLGAATQARSVDDIFRRMHEADKLTLNLILRADVQGSVEAIVEAIQQIKSTKVSTNIIQSGTGSIAVNDVERAGNGKALIIGFNVSPESGVNALARHHGVRIQTFRIIYELLDFVKQEMLALLPAEYREVVRGHAFVKQVFDLGKDGVVAGSIVNDGFITTKGQMRVLRRGKLLHTGAIATIRHFKESVEEVKMAQECGVMLESFKTFEEGDVLECFAFEEIPKTL